MRYVLGEEESRVESKWIRNAEHLDTDEVER